MSEHKNILDYRDGIINSSSSITKTYTTTTLANIDATNGAISVEIDAAVLYRQPITIMRVDETLNTIFLQGINGTKIVGGPLGISQGKYSYITLVIRSKNEMVVIGKS